jgi:hypothetical protein
MVSSPSFPCPSLPFPSFAVAAHQIHMLESTIARDEVPWLP